MAAATACAAQIPSRPLETAAQRHRPTGGQCWIASRQNAGRTDRHGHAIAPHLVTKGTRLWGVQPGGQIACRNDVAKAARPVVPLPGQQRLPPLGFDLRQRDGCPIGQKQVGVEEGKVGVIGANRAIGQETR